MLYLINNNITINTIITRKDITIPNSAGVYGRGREVGK